MKAHAHDQKSYPKSELARNVACVDRTTLTTQVPEA
jgi:hypothetical protein